MPTEPPAPPPKWAKRFVLVLSLRRSEVSPAVVIERIRRAAKFLGLHLLASREIPVKADPLDQANAAAQARPQDRNRGLRAREAARDDGQH
ncbi:MAG TPA: hypothetical protein VG269_26750 [Tepidisphaeraceae bacterium]|jgi:hypothetical protein|nr:hypothetical protein [Tepidisphaeraceae bacterium]